MASSFFASLMRKIQSVRFLKSAVSSEQYPQHSFPEIAFIGRSNVGKSSLLNTLVHKKNVARVSNTPGRTQTINFFVVDDIACFVDLPGYGFAKVPEEIHRQWQPMIETYLRRREQLRSVVLIVDARHAPSKQDMLMWEWLRASQIPTIIVVTKIDKIPKTKRAGQMNMIRESLNVEPSQTMLEFSALTGEGVQTLWQAIAQVTLPATAASS